MAASLKPTGARASDMLVSERRTSPTVRDLEQDLRALRAEAAGTVDEGIRPPVIRAALLTLIAVAETPEEAAAAPDLVLRLIGHASGRVLLVELVPDGAPLSAQVRAHCHGGAGARQLCGEEIVLRSAPAGDDLLSGVLLPLLVPDLPVFLYWPRAAALLESRPGEDVPRGADLLCDLDPAVDYLVLDSALARDPVALQSRLRLLAQRAPGTGMTPRDLNWARLLAWREALAGAVDDGRLDPAGIERIVIEARGGCGGLCPARPALLAGWLIDRLGWTTTRVVRGPERIDIEAGEGRRLAIRLAEPTPGRPVPRPGQLERVTIEGGGQALSLDRAAVPRSDDAAPALLAGEIDRRGVDPSYRSALELAVTLLEEAR